MISSLFLEFNNSSLLQDFSYKILFTVAAPSSAMLRVTASERGKKIFKLLVRYVYINVYKSEYNLFLFVI